MSNRFKELLSVVENAFEHQDMVTLQEFVPMSIPKTVRRKARKARNQLKASARRGSQKKKARYVRARFSRN